MAEAAFSNDRPPAVGDVIADKYRVESVVGTGGMGVVLAARHLQLGQMVAIKVLSAPDESRRDEANLRFLREAQAAARLRSDHVVRIYDVGTLPSGLPFMVMELLHGSDLGSLLDAEVRLDQALAVDFMLQACDAIGKAHRAGIVHRDLKPSNLYVTERSDGSPLLKVLDFGISKTIGDKGESIDGTLTATRAVMGSPYYMSPEQVRDARRVDGRTDIWSLGVILHEALTGEPAFQADTFPGVCAAIVADPPIPVRARRPDVHPDLEAVVMRCLEKDPGRRFQTVDELVEALLPFGSRSAAESPARRASRPHLSPSLEGAAAAASAPYERMLPSRPFIEGATLSPDHAPQGSVRSARSGSGDTKTQLSAGFETASTMPAGTTRAGRRWLLPAAGAALVIIVALVALGSMNESPATATSAAPPPSAISAPVSVTEQFTLSIESTPSGAEVLEGSTSLGTTPLSLTMASPPPGKLRLLTVRKPGFKPYSLEQGPARGEVRIHAALVAEERAAPAPSPSSEQRPSAAPAPARRPAKQSAAAKKPAAEKTPPAPAGDIRLQR